MHRILLITLILSVIFNAALSVAILQCKYRSTDIAVAKGGIREIRASQIFTREGELFFEEKIPNDKKIKFRNFVYMPEALGEGVIQVGDGSEIIAYSNIDSNRVIVLSGDLNIIETTWDKIEFKNSRPFLKK